MKESAGTLLYRQNAELEVLLVHPSGNYNAKAPWSIPKGLPEDGEALETAARRETQEETGVVPGQLDSIGSIEYKKSRKRVHCWIGTAQEAKPICNSWEVDRAEFLSLEKAKTLIHPDQAIFIERLKARLKC